MNIERVLTIAWKDALEFLRDRRSIGLMIVSAFLFPLLGLMVTGLQSQQHGVVYIAVCDRGWAARELAEMLAQGVRQYTPFNASIVEESPGDCGPVPGAIATVVIPAGFTANASSIDKPVTVYIYRLVGSAAGEAAENTVRAIVSAYSSRLAEKRVEMLAEKAGVTVSPENILNPLRLRTASVTATGVQVSPREEAAAEVARFLAFSVFFVLNPAAIAVADSVARERERGTGELIAVTPVNGVEFVLGKTAGSLAAVAVAGGLDLAAAIVYTYSIGGRVSAPLLLAVFHAAQVVLAVLVTTAITVLATLLVPGQRTATLLTSTITGLAMMVFFSALFIDLENLSTPLRVALYLVPYTHTVIAIKAYALGETWTAILHTGLLLGLTTVLIVAAAKTYRPDRIVRSS